MNEADLRAIEERCNAAGPGPWDVGTAGFAGVVRFDGDDIHPVAAVMDRGIADFIAGARQDVPELLVEVRRMQGEVEEIESHDARRRDVYILAFQRAEAAEAEVCLLRAKLLNVMVPYAQDLLSPDEGQRRYQIDNLLWLLENTSRSPADTGDWHGQLRMRLVELGADAKRANATDLRLTVTYDVANT